ncbi:MAG: DNA recombination protein RmuC [Bacteriovoracaceae bacterium]|nr:DNA recombination protein RmuC [Bacteriovoracaceae bacterium]
MEKRLGDGLDKSRETLSQVLERLVKVDTAQKQITSLSENVVMLQNVLTDKKTRGIFGEVQLKQILVNVFGESMGHIFQLQATMTNGKIADATLMLPEPLGLVAVDAKFPLENYRRMVDGESDEMARQNASKEFAKNLKKHIDDISSKYIIPNVTSDQAILFLPAEAIFSEVHAHHSEIVEYAAKKKVWLTSPTTLMAILSTVQAVLINIERNKHIDEIHQEINQLGVDFERYEERWEDLVKHLGTIQKDVDRLNISNKKITDRFKKIIRL